MSLFKYILKRILISFPIMFIALTITFFLGRSFPGDPFLAVFSRGSEAEHELYDSLVESHGLNDPIWLQYINYLRNLFSGNWGRSWGFWRQDGPEVKILVRYSFPITLEIIVLSLFLAYFLGKKIGIFTATRKNKRSSDFLRIITIFASGIPNIIVCLVLMLIIKKTPWYNLIGGIKSPFFPDPPRVSGMRLVDCLIDGDFYLFFDSALHYLWPVLVLGFQFTVLFSRTTRSNILTILQENYINTARAKGCSEKAIINKHAYRVAKIPNIAYLGILFPIILSNLMLIESILEIPGFGNLLLRSFNYLDYNTEIICVSISVVAIIILNLITDILYSIFDPRIRYE
ncbi:MAG: ABC transporter permease [Promethearchaeota archaeon]